MTRRVVVHQGSNRADQTVLIKDGCPSSATRHNLAVASFSTALQGTGITENNNMCPKKAVLTVAALMSCAAVNSGEAQTVPIPNPPTSDGISSARPAPGEARSEPWTPEKMRQAEPMPLPKVDPDAVRAAGARAGQSGLRSLEAQPHGMTDSHPPSPPSRP
jgi:hypothetical protein